MSRISHLHPRSPSTRAKENELPELIRFSSLDTILEEQPIWLDELSIDSNAKPEGKLRRSVSDSATIFDIGEGGEVCSEFEGSCVYGPNSPRQKSNLSEPELCALMESIPKNKLEYVTVDAPACDDINQGDFQISAGELDEEKAARRRSGQRSRVRKLQYIAELERTVEAYQTWGAELANGVASIFQQRVALSLENKNLRQQIAGLRQEKMIKDGQYQYLKNEAEKLKMIHGRHRRSKSAASCFDSHTMESDPFGATNVQMLDFPKLNLGPKSVAPLRNNFGR